ncbi:NAD-dependent epimerase/dehydratase family protein [bacterium]|nr:NAD-dependent epimerase/dehydratase family protein [bacterium]
MKNILITGSSGYIGSKIVHALEKTQQVETIIGLDITPPRNPARKLKFYQHDVRKPITDLLTRHEVDTVIHTAYVLSPLHDKGLMEDININGTKNVLSSCQASSVSHILYTSSTTAYGFHKDNPIPMDEDQPLRGNDDFTYAKNKKEIEFLFKSFQASVENINVTILRPCFVIGPGVDNLISRYLKKPIAIIPREYSPIQFVHEDDLLRAIEHCLANSVFGIYNIAGEGAITFPEMTSMLGTRAVFLPFPLLKLLNEVAWRARLKFLTETPSPGLALIRYPWIASTNKFTSRTGFQFKYSSQQAFESFAKGT